MVLDSRVSVDTRVGVQRGIDRERRHFSVWLGGSEISSIERVLFRLEPSSVFFYSFNPGGDLKLVDATYVQSFCQTLLSIRG